MYNGVQIIAEVKTLSPFGFSATHSWEELFAIANNVGDIISIHTDTRWGGSFDLIKKAKQLTTKPVLAKGIHQNDTLIEKAIKSGADYVLVVGRIPKIHNDKCFIEPNTISELISIPLTYKVVWNERDLSTGGTKEETFAMARQVWKGWMCQASFITSVEDIQDGANAVLVGSYLADFMNSLNKPSER